MLFCTFFLVSFLCSTQEKHSRKYISAICLCLAEGRGSVQPLDCLSLPILSTIPGSQSLTIESIQQLDGAFWPNCCTNPSRRPTVSLEMRPFSMQVYRDRWPHLPIPYTRTIKSSPCHLLPLLALALLLLPLLLIQEAVVYIVHIAHVSYNSYIARVAPVLPNHVAEELLLLPLEVFPVGHDPLLRSLHGNLNVDAALEDNWTAYLRLILANASAYI